MEAELRLALELYGRTRDDRGEAWALTQLGRARVVDGDPGPAVEGLREALARHREAEDARGEAWTQYYLGQALEVGGGRDEAVRELERARTMFSRMRDVYGLAHARHHSGRVTRDQRAAQTGNLRNSGFARQLLVDARADFRRIGLAHGEAWTCLELAVIDAGNGRLSQALDLCEEAVRLFISYGDRRGEDWARFLRCTVLPYAVPAAPEEARAELGRLVQAPHPARDGRLEDCLETYGVILGRGWIRRRAGRRGGSASSRTCTRGRSWGSRGPDAAPRTDIPGASCVSGTAGRYGAHGQRPPDRSSRPGRRAEGLREGPVRGPCGRPAGQRPHPGTPGAGEPRTPPVGPTGSGCRPCRERPGPMRLRGLLEVHPAHVPVHRLHQGPHADGEGREHDEAEEAGRHLVLVEGVTRQRKELGQCCLRSAHS